MGTDAKGRTWTWISPGDASRALRGHLKEVFPGLRFKQRLDVYSGGASVHVHLHPDEAERLDEVRRVAARYAWSDFDGSIDLASRRSVWIDERNRVVGFAKTEGTVGSRGYLPAEDLPAPRGGLVEARGGADFVFVDCDPWFWRTDVKPASLKGGGA